MYKMWQGSGTHKEHYNVSKTGHHTVGFAERDRGLTETWRGQFPHTGLPGKSSDPTKRIQPARDNSTRRKLEPLYPKPPQHSLAQIQGKPRKQVRKLLQFYTSASQNTELCSSGHSIDLEGQSERSDSPSLTFLQSDLFSCLLYHREGQEIS